MGLLLLALAATAPPAAADFRYVAPPADTGTGPSADAGANAVEIDESAAGAGSGPRTRLPDAPPEAGAAGGAHAEDPAPAAGRPADGSASVPGPTVWHVRRGEMLRTALARWGARAEVEVTFLTDRRYRLDGAAAFEGSFADAADALFRALGHLPHPPAGALSKEGATLAVTHRSRAQPEQARPEQTQPEQAQPEQAQPEQAQPEGVNP